MKGIKIKYLIFKFDKKFLYDKIIDIYFRKLYLVCNCLFCNFYLMFFVIVMMNFRIYYCRFDSKVYWKLLDLLVWV